MILKPIGKLPDEKKKQEYASRTPYFDGQKFHNIHDFDLMVNGKSESSKDRVPKEKIPTVRPELPVKPSKDLSFIWLGHSSILVSMSEKIILIDPVLTIYASPFDFVGVKRFSDIPLTPEELPFIDILLLSHDHYDHLDYQTLMKLKNKVGHIVVPLGLENTLISFGFKAEQISALSWWEEKNIDGIAITSLPSQHFSNRNPLYSNASWWCGFVIKDDRYCVYYSGDGGYSDTFKEIGKKFDIDLAFLECGQYDKAWSSCHMFPEETATAAKDLNAAWMVPVHWGTFCLCRSAWNDSPIRAKRKAKELGVNIATPLIGENVNFSRIDSYQEDWYENRKKDERNK